MFDVEKAIEDIRKKREEIRQKYQKEPITWEECKWYENSYVLEDNIASQTFSI
jgi:hypothetical protein